MFWLYDGSYNYHYDVPADKDNFTHFFAFGLMLLIKDTHPEAAKDPRLVLSAHVQELRVFLQASAPQTLLEAFELTTKFPAYEEALKEVAHLLFLCGATTAEVKMNIPEDRIETIFWQTRDLRMESCKPLYHKLIFDAMLAKKPIVVTGDPGAGKTRMIPKMVHYYYMIISYMEIFVGLRKKVYPVLCGFPRRLLVTENYRGYSADFNLDISFINKDGPEADTNIFAHWFKIDVGKMQELRIPSNIKYIPSPMILGTPEKLLAQPFYDCLIMDEFHEHDMKLDILFSKGHQLEKQIIVMTATPSPLDLKLFAKLLPEYVACHIAAESTFAINIIPSVGKTIHQIVTSIALRRGESILIFVPTVLQAYEVMLKYNGYNGCVAIVFFSELALEMRLLIEKYEKQNKSLIIVATPAAESSITITSLKYVIDLGTAIKPKILFNPKSNPQIKITYDLVAIKKGNADQRKGRVGRRSPGTYYPLFDYYGLAPDMDSMFDYADPITYILTMLRYNITLDHLFLELTKERTEKARMVATILGNAFHINLYDMLCGTYAFPAEPLDIVPYPWIESVVYASTLSPEEKEGYDLLWNRNPSKWKVGYYKIMPYNRTRMPHKNAIVKGVYHNNKNQYQYRLKWENSSDTIVFQSAKKIFQKGQYVSFLSTYCPTKLAAV